MNTNVKGTTAIVAILGDPIRHSKSPVMQNAAFAACNLDYVYVPFAVSPENLGVAVAGLRALGVAGFNVTIPHKTAIIPFLDRLEESAVAAGAVNTVQVCGSLLIGHNTDGDGLVDALAVDLDFTPGDGLIVVLGAGGAARGAVAARCRTGARQITLVNRSRDNAERLCADMQDRFPDTIFTSVISEGMGCELAASTALLLNTTSVGMRGERFAQLDLSVLSPSAKVYDMVYGASATPLVSDASRLGLAAVNGLGMLVAQGERAFKIWTGVKPPSGVMGRALG